MSAEPALEPLPRRVGLWSATAILMGAIIGSGIFRTPADIAATMGSVGGSALIWVAGGVISICLALCLAELATMFPRPGGLFVFLREAFGPGVAFLWGWTFMLINPSQAAAIALISAEYLDRFVPLAAIDAMSGMPGAGKRVAATALILFVTISNYVSVRLAASIQNVATSAKVFAIVIIAATIFTIGSGEGAALSAPMSFTAPTLGAIGIAFVAVLWPYEGAASACALSGEVRDPARNLPRALIFGMIAVTVLYLLINVAYFYALPLAEVAGSGSVAADAMQAVTGPRGAAVVAGCVVVSTFGALAATGISDPRVVFAMSRERLFFERVGRVHPRYQTPHVAIVYLAALSVIYLWSRTIEQLAAQFILGFWLFYMIAVIGLVRMRRTRPDVPRPYRTWGYPFVPALFVLASGWLLVSSLFELPGISLLNLALTLAGIPVYLLWKRTAQPASMA